MPHSEILPVAIRAVIPTNGGTALFLQAESKTFLIFIDNAVGTAIAMHINQIPPQRPQTHDLLAGLLVALGAKVDRVVINDVQEETFFARVIVTAENEVMEKKVVEMDARPSDCIALALRMEAPLFATRKVIDTVSDRSDLLEELESRHRGTEGQEE